MQYLFLAIIITFNIFSIYGSVDDLEVKFPSEKKSLVELSVGKTHFEILGPEDGEPVVLIHGVSGPMQVWDKTISTLVDSGYRVIRYDLYGRGFSERVNQVYNLELYYTQLKELLDFLELSRNVTLIGSSMGAIIATEFAVRKPRLIKKLILIGPAGFTVRAPAIAKLRDVPILGDIAFNLFGEKAILEQNKKYFFEPSIATDFLSFYKEQLKVKGSKEAILSTMRHTPVQSYSYGYEDLGRLSLPVQVIWGRQDRTFPFKNNKSLRFCLLYTSPSPRDRG